MILEREAKKVNWRKLFLELDAEELQSDRFAGLSTVTADLFKNAQLNRYYNVLAYDQTRVKLKHLNTEIYINANYVKIPTANRKYILTQGPLEHTVDHFWLMCYQERSDCIVMLCRCWENSRDKSAQYWPSEIGKSFTTEVGLDIDLLDEKDYGDYYVRRLLIRNTEGGDDREVKHFHYYNWPDFNVPKSPEAFLDFLQAVRDTGCFETSSPNGPPIVHCSAGIGRSGTFCLVDSSLVLAAQGHEMSMSTIRSLLLDMRTQRMGLIQTEDQLRFSVNAIITGHSRQPPQHDSVNSGRERHMGSPRDGIKAREEVGGAASGSCGGNPHKHNSPHHVDSSIVPGQSRLTSPNPTPSQPHHNNNNNDNNNCNHRTQDPADEELPPAPPPPTAASAIRAQRQHGHHCLNGKRLSESGTRDGPDAELDQQDLVSAGDEKSPGQPDSKKARHSSSGSGGNSDGGTVRS